MSVTLTGFRATIIAAHSFSGFLDAPSATAQLSLGVLTVKFSAGRLRLGQAASFVLENFTNPRTLRTSFDNVSVALSGFTATGISVIDNTNFGVSSRISPSLFDVHVRLNSSVPGAHVTVSISFTPSSVQNLGTFSITLSGFSVAAGHNITVGFVPVDGLGIRLGEGFIGLNNSASYPAATAAIVSGVLTVSFLSGQFLENTPTSITIHGLVSTASPQPALSSLHAATFSFTGELLDVTNVGTMSAIYGTLPLLEPPPIDPSFLSSLDGHWTGTCSAFAGTPAARPHVGIVCSPSPLSVPYTVQYSSTSYTYTRILGSGSSSLPLYPNMDKSLNNFSSESVSSIVQITSARDGILKGIVSGNIADFSSSSCSSVSFTDADSLTEWGWGSIGSHTPFLQKCGPALQIPRTTCLSSAGLYSYTCFLKRSPVSASGSTPKSDFQDSSHSSSVPSRRMHEVPRAFHIDQGGALSATVLTAVWGGSGHGVFIGGNFKKAGNVSFTRHIAQWHAGKYTPLGYGLDGPVSALSVDRRFLYVGGSFSRAFQSSTSIVRSGPILKWDLLQSMYLPLISCGQSSTFSGYLPVSSGIVSSIYLREGGVVFAGRFSSVCTEHAGNIAFVSGLGDINLFDGGVSGGHISSLGSVGSDLYVGGSFTSAGSVSTRGIVRWDGSSWNALGGGLARGSVQAIAVMGSTVFVAGNFDSVDGGRLVASGVAAWENCKWIVVGRGLSGTVHSLTVATPCLVAGGSFRIAGSLSSTGLAQLCNETEGPWEAISHQPGFSDIGASVKFVVAVINGSYRSPNISQ